MAVTSLQKVQERLLAALQAASFGAKVVGVDPYPPAVTDATRQQLVMAGDGDEWMIRWDGTQSEDDTTAAANAVGDFDMTETPSDAAEESPAKISQGTYAAMLLAMNQLIRKEEVQEDAASLISGAAKDITVLTTNFSDTSTYFVSGPAASPTISVNKGPVGGFSLSGPVDFGAQRADGTFHVTRGQFVFGGTVPNGVNAAGPGQWNIAGFRDWPTILEAQSLDQNFQPVGKVKLSRTNGDTGPNAATFLVGDAVNGSQRLVLEGTAIEIYEYLNVTFKGDTGPLPLGTYYVKLRATIEDPVFGDKYTGKCRIMAMVGFLQNNTYTPWVYPTSVTTTASTPSYPWLSPNAIRSKDNQFAFCAGAPRRPCSSPPAVVNSDWLNALFRFSVADFGMSEGVIGNGVRIRGIELQIKKANLSAGGQIWDETLKFDRPVADNKASPVFWQRTNGSEVPWNTYGGPGDRWGTTLDNHVDFVNGVTIKLRAALGTSALLETTTAMIDTMRMRVRYEPRP